MIRIRYLEGITDRLGSNVDVLIFGDHLRFPFLSRLSFPKNQERREEISSDRDIEFEV